MSCYLGMITRYLAERGFGFLWSDKAECECFFHIRKYRGIRPPELGDIVSFQLTEGPKGPEAEEVRLIESESGRERIPQHVGLTVWTGPGAHGDYGLATHTREHGDGTFIHCSALVDGTNEVLPSTLYHVDVAGTKDRYIGLNVRPVDDSSRGLIAKLASDPTENPAVRLKAMEILSQLDGRRKEFEDKVHDAVLQLPDQEPSVTKIELPGGIRVSQKGEPSDNTVSIVKSVVIAGVTIVAMGVVAGLAKALSGQK